MLQSTNHNHRIDGCNSVASMIQSDHFAGLVASKLLDTLVHLIEDKMIGVAIAASGCLRNICAEIGDVVSKELVNQGLLPKLLYLLEQASTALTRMKSPTPVANDPPLHWYSIKLEAAEQLLMQIFALLAFICDASDIAANQFTELQSKNNGLHISLIMDRTTITPESTPIALQSAIDALHFIRSITLGNEVLNLAILGQNSMVTHLMNLSAITSTTPVSTVYDTLRQLMTKSLTYQLSRKQGAIASAFSVPNYPRISNELSALSSSILVHLLQTISETKSTITTEQVETVTRSLIQGFTNVMSSVNLAEILSISMQSLSHLPSLIQQLHTAKQSGTLHEIEEKDIFSNQNETFTEESSLSTTTTTASIDDPSVTYDDNNLPIDNLLADGVQMHMRIYSMYVSCMKLTLDSIASFLSLLPEVDEEEQNQVTPIQVIFRNLSVQFLFENNLASSKSFYFEQMIQLSGLRLISEEQMRLQQIPLTTLSQESCTKVLQYLPEINYRQLGKVYDQLRIQSTVAIASCLLFIPSTIIPRNLIDSLIPYITQLLVTSDVQDILTPPALGEVRNTNVANSTSMSICSADELENIVTIIQQCITMSYYTTQRDIAWKSLSPESISQCVVVSPETISALCTIITSTSKRVSDQVKCISISIVGVLGQSPAMKHCVEQITNSLLDCMLHVSKVRVTEISHDVVVEFINSMIDIYSEDDRNVDIYTKLNVTQRLHTFAPIYNNALREVKKNIKNLDIKQRRMLKTRQLLMTVQHAEEAYENLTQFVKYKKSMKL